MCMCMCVYICTHECMCLWKSETDIRLPGAVVTDNCDPPGRVLGTEFGSSARAVHDLTCQTVPACVFLLANCFLKFCSLGNTLLFQAYLDELVELHRRLMTLRERHILQQIVNLIEETGHFHITNTTFDFDLCSLDKTTVRKLQSYLETSGTS